MSFSGHSLALDLRGLRVLELFGLVHIEEEVLQQFLSLTQLLGDLRLVLQRELFLIVFCVLREEDKQGFRTLKETDDLCLKSSKI